MNSRTRWCWNRGEPTAGGSTSCCARWLPIWRHRLCFGRCMPGLPMPWSTRRAVIPTGGWSRDTTSAPSSTTRLPSPLRQLGNPQQVIVEGLVSADDVEPAALSAHIATLTELLETMRATGLQTFVTSFDAVLARPLTAAGQPDQARARIESALQLAEDTGMQIYDAEAARPHAHRLRRSSSRHHRRVRTGPPPRRLRLRTACRPRRFRTARSGCACRTGRRAQSLPDRLPVARTGTGQGGIELTGEQANDADIGPSATRLAPIKY